MLELIGKLYEVEARWRKREVVPDETSEQVFALALDISHDTVKLDVRHILSKLGLTSRVEAAEFAVEHRVAAGDTSHRA